ncbi:hypothetical protein FB107DRAFT_272019 [Schizophyllum commune]
MGSLDQCRAPSPRNNYGITTEHGKVNTRSLPLRLTGLTQRRHQSSELKAWQRVKDRTPSNPISPARRRNEIVQTQHRCIEGSGAYATDFELDLRALPSGVPQCLDASVLLRMATLVACPTAILMAEPHCRFGGSGCFDTQMTFKLAVARKCRQYLPRQPNATASGVLNGIFKSAILSPQPHDACKCVNVPRLSPSSGIRVANDLIDIRPSRSTSTPHKIVNATASSPNATDTG